MTVTPPEDFDHDEMVNRIYEIALEPASLDEFIEFWHDTGLLTRIADDGDVRAALDERMAPHIKRAEVFLQRGQDARPDLAEYLEPYNNLGAFVVSSTLRIEVANSGGLAAFDAKAGDDLDNINLPDTIRQALVEATTQVLRAQPSGEKLLKVDLDSKNGSLLFRITQLDQQLENGPAALVISTQFHWQDSASELLGNVFQLTSAEQSIVRLLADGGTPKRIATVRNTSEGTVRGQIKAIAAKMNVRGQGDIIRLAMAFNKFSNRAGRDGNGQPLMAPALSRNWLEAEVWKPFKSVTLPDHRQLTYNDMGPATGNPVLLSHMGSCMARWSRSMIKMAFETNLRVICPLRAGYGHSDKVAPTADPFETARNDCTFLLESLRVPRAPYVVQGSDLPLAVDMVAHKPNVISELIAVGGQLRLAGDQHFDGKGKWQNFFVAIARNTPNMTQFAAKAVMAMSRRIGPDAMLRQLCKDSKADLATLDVDEMREVLVENLKLMAGKSTNAAGAFAMEYVAFQQDWSPLIQATRDHKVRMFLADQDPTIDLEKIPNFQAAYPWIEFKILPDAGLALMYQKAEELIPLISKAAQDATQSTN